MAKCCGSTVFLERGISAQQKTESISLTQHNYKILVIWMCSELELPHARLTSSAHCFSFCTGFWRLEVLLRSH